MQGLTASAAPTSVTAVPGERSAVVSWQAPENAGSFAITHYQVTSTPGGRSCLSTTPTCVIDGLTADVPYTFTVRALNGAGWGAWSEPSPALAWPEEEPTSILVTGGRTTGRYIEFTGSVTGTMPGSLRPMITFHGRTTPVMGRVVVPAPDGTFTWSRRLARAATITFIAGDVTSSPIEVASTGREQRR